MKMKTATLISFLAIPSAAASRILGRGRDDAGLFSRGESSKSPSANIFHRRADAGSFSFSLTLDSSAAPPSRPSGPGPTPSPLALDVPSSMIASKMSPSLQKLHRVGPNSTAPSSQKPVLPPSEETGEAIRDASTSHLPSPTASPFDDATLVFLPNNRDRPSNNLRDVNFSGIMEPITDDSTSVSLFAIVFLAASVCGSGAAVVAIATLVNAHRKGRQDSSSLGGTQAMSDDDDGIPCTIEISVEPGLPSEDVAKHDIALAQESPGVPAFRFEGSTLEPVPEDSSIDYGYEESSI